MVPLAHLSPQPKQYLDWFSRYCMAHDRDRQTDQQTDFATQSVTVGLIDICSTAMRPNDNNNKTLKFEEGMMEGAMNVCHYEVLLSFVTLLMWFCRCVRFISRCWPTSERVSSTI